MQEMNKEQFMDLVEAELKKQTLTREEIQALNSDKELWRICLVEILQTVQVSLSESKQDRLLNLLSDDDLSDEFNWRARALGFKKIVEARMREIKHQIREENVSKTGKEGSFTDVAREIVAAVKETNAKIDELIAIHRGKKA
jgi:hypothetical protein